MPNLVDGFFFTVAHVQAVRAIDHHTVDGAYVLVTVHHALGHGRNHREANFLQRISGRAQHVLDTRRHIVHALLPCGSDDVALTQRPPEEGALERVG